MSLFDLFGNGKKNQNQETSSSEVIRLIQGIGSQIEVNLKDEGNLTLAQLIEKYKEDLGIGNQDLYQYTFSASGNVLAPSETLNSLISKGLLKGGATVVASTRSDSKAG